MSLGSRERGVPIKVHPGESRGVLGAGIRITQEQGARRNGEQVLRRRRKMCSMRNPCYVEMRECLQTECVISGTRHSRGKNGGGGGPEGEGPSS